MPDIFTASDHQTDSPVPELVPVSVLESDPLAGTTTVTTTKTVTTTSDEIAESNEPRCVDDYSEVMRHEEPTKGQFHAFSPKPQNLSFSSQQKNEQILLLLRRHPITQIGWIVIAAVMLAAPLIFGFIPFFDFLIPKYQVAGVIGWYLLTLGFILQSFLTWFFNVNIITDERIIDVDFYNLLHRDVSAAKIDNIEDVTEVTGGTLQSIFDFGSVVIQTAGTQQKLEFEDIPQPAKVTRLLNELILEEEKEKLENRVN